MEPDQKSGTEENKSDKSMDNLAARKIDEQQADQVRGGAPRRHDDENPK